MPASPTKTREKPFFSVATLIPGPLPFPGINAAGPPADGTWDIETA